MDKVVNKKPVDVIYIEVPSPQQSKEAFIQLESKLPSLKGRKFYGIAFSDKYFVAVEIHDEQEPKKYGLPTYIIPGGKYAKTEVKDYMQNLHKIPTTFEKLEKEYPRDETRPAIEFYERGDKLICLLPLKS
ncbi:hypothetical protein COV18_03815 [Candidatus Woesearchaeota archaeon CG10_big_fil_rev_8_21_14_0_10_37_12]|nr:MAG: hypothetical protein COV18_03815 [Candidatus Woesearchaeota archaeon CG10_big_fil_rev_8_21_14_0_10_37_12]